MKTRVDLDLACLKMIFGLIQDKQNHIEVKDNKSRNKSITGIKKY